MIGLLSFIVSIVAVILSFFADMRLASFAMAILAIIISGAAAVSYFVFLFLAQ